MIRTEFQPLNGQPTISPENCYCLRRDFFSQCNLGIDSIDVWLRNMGNDYPWLRALQELKPQISQHRVGLFLDYIPANQIGQDITTSAVDTEVTLGRYISIDSSVIMTGSKVSQGVTIENSVIYPNSTILEGTVIRNSIIGPNTLIGNNALVNGSLIGSTCLVGFSREVSRSIIGSGTRLEHGGTFLDSIACVNVWLAGYTGTRNMRADKHDIAIKISPAIKFTTNLNKLGVIIGPNSQLLSRSTTMPGVIIGADSIVNADTVVFYSLPDNCHIRSHQQTEITRN